MRTITKKIYAEAFGTFLLTSVAVVTLSNGASIAVHPLVFIGTTLVMMVYLFGTVSGAQFNPAVTIGLAVVKKITPNDAVQYISAQVFGAVSAWLLLQMTPAQDFNVLVAQALGPNTLMDFTSECVGTAVLALSVASVAYSRVSQSLSGLVVGAGLVVGVGLASELFLSGTAVLNPAVGLALGASTLPHIFGQIAGGIIGALLGAGLFKPEH